MPKASYNWSELQRGYSEDDTGYSLSLACRDGDLARARELLDEGADVNWANEWGSALYYACFKGQVQVVQLLLDRGARIDFPDEKYTMRNTALMISSLFDHVEIVKLLLDRGALIDIQDNNGWTALFHAISRYPGTTDSARLLLERGADISIKDKDGMTAKDFAEDIERKGRDNRNTNDEQRTNFAIILHLLNEYETKKKNTPPQASAVEVLIMEPINKTLQEENERLKSEIEVLKEREICKQELVDEYKIRSMFLEDESQRSKDENQRLRDENQRIRDEVSCLKEKEARLDILLSKEWEEVGKQELMDEFRADSMPMEDENQRAKDCIQRGKDEIQRFRDEVSSLKEKEARLTAENEYLKRREEENRLERNTERTRFTVDDEIQRFRDEVSSLKEKEIRLNVENEFLKCRDEQLRLENEYLKRRDEELRMDRTAERAIFQMMMSSLLNGIEDRKRKRNEDDATT